MVFGGKATIPAGNLGLLRAPPIGNRGLGASARTRRVRDDPPSYPKWSALSPTEQGAGGSEGSEGSLSESRGGRATLRRRPARSVVRREGGLDSTALVFRPSAAAMGSASDRTTRRRTRPLPERASSSGLRLVGGGVAHPRSPIEREGAGVCFGAGSCSPLANPAVGSGGAAEARPPPIRRFVDR